MTDQPRTIRVEALTRVEGEGGLYVRLRGRQVEEVQLQIYEPPRLFESLLRGRALEDVPDIVARICGICPVAYQMSAVHALERALGVKIPSQIRALRRLFYCGEWIESHALHVYLLHAPDFLGYESGLAMAKDYPQHVERGLRLKKYGNQLLDVLGGRAIHPINARVGGFYRLPRREELTALLPHLQWGVEAAVETTRWVAGFDYPMFDQPYDMVSLVHDDEYPMNEGRIGSLDGWSCEVADFEQQFEERQVPHSTALHAVRRQTDRSYLVGPLARVNLNRQRLSPTARQIANELKITWPCRNIFQSIIARGLELIHAFEEACQIITDYRPTGLAWTPYEYRAASGAAATEAPRGLLYHRYEVDEAGRIKLAKIVPPTSQNQAQIEADLRQFIPQSPAVDDDAALTGQCEHLVRSYDPCISCSTHFLKVKVDRT
jgi:coenzyme F420-reducing hydrogenase alpha subunit